MASQTIKRLRGQADAVASAYSLKDYSIADDLGGNAAYEVAAGAGGAVRAFGWRATWCRTTWASTRRG